MNDFFAELFYKLARAFIGASAIGLLMGMLLGTALTVCEGVGAISIGWFWATFPFWAWAGPLAAGVCLTVIAYLIGESL